MAAQRRPRVPSFGAPHRSILWLAVLVLLLLLYVSIRMSYADVLAHRPDLAALNAAIELEPGNCSYLLRRAVLDESRSAADLRRAAALNPVEAASWLALGLNAEKSRDYASAETCLREAVRRDATYLPLWTLANFYYRREQWGPFWKSVQAAAAIYQGDASALYLLCIRAGGDPAQILEQVVRPEADARRHFLEVLFAQQKLDTLPLAASKLLGHNRAQDSGALLAACGLLADQSRQPDAIRLWNAMIAAGRLPFERLDPAGGCSLTNGGFRQFPSGAVYDWRVMPDDGATVHRLTAHGGLSLQFSGRPDASVVLLTERVPILPGRVYRLTYLYNREGSEMEAACRWRVDSQLSPPLDSAAVTTGQFDFVTAPDALEISLDLVLEREAGKTLPEGRLDLQHVKLSPLDR